MRGVSCIVRLIALAACLSACANRVYAQAPFALEPKREWVLTGTGVLLGVTGLTMISRVDPLTPDEIGNLNINDVNDFDRDGVKLYRETLAGDGMLYASYLIPLAFLARADTREDWKTIGVMWMETVVLQVSISSLVKPAVRRTRPYVYDPETPLDKKTTKVARLSFYSGHTSSTAANCFFIARTLNEYVNSRRARVLIWTGAALYPAVTGYLRMDSGHHWRTDVMTGYVVGGFIGYMVPQLHLSSRGGRVSYQPLSPSGSPGLSLCVSF